MNIVRIIGITFLYLFGSYTIAYLVTKHKILTESELLSLLHMSYLILAAVAIVIWLSRVLDRKKEVYVIVRKK